MNSRRAGRSAGILWALAVGLTGINWRMPSAECPLEKCPAVQPLQHWALGIPHFPAGSVWGQAPPGLDHYVTEVMRTFEVPGLSVAIVKDGRVLVSRGYGVRKLGEAAPVNQDTRFGIASNTKLFTATALALLVEEGKLEWDAPVIRYLPGFALPGDSCVP